MLVLYFQNNSGAVEVNIIDDGGFVLTTLILMMRPLNAMQ